MTFDFSPYPQQALKAHLEREHWVLQFRAVTGWSEEKVREGMARADAAAAQTLFRADRIYAQVLRAISLGEEPDWEKFV